MEANLREMKVEMRAGQELLKEEMLAKMEAHQERVLAKMDSQLEKMEACLGKAEAMDLVVSPEEMESVVVHEEVHKEEAAVEMIGARKDWPVDWYLAVRCRSKQRNRAREMVCPGRSWLLPAEG
jgi:hypothetical protein